VCLRRKKHMREHVARCRTQNTHRRASCRERRHGGRRGAAEVAALRARPPAASATCHVTASPTIWAGMYVGTATPPSQARGVTLRRMPAARREA
jgi:hypothetical protein